MQLVVPLCGSSIDPGLLSAGGGRSLKLLMSRRWTLVIAAMLLSLLVDVTNQQPFTTTSATSSTGCDSSSASAMPILYDTFPLGDYHIRLYRNGRERTAADDDESERSKFYYAPLTLLEHTSAKSGRNGLTGEYQMTFKVEMWNQELHDIVTQYLSNVTHTTVEWHRVSVLPFDKVSIRCRGCKIRLSSSWYSFVQSPKKMQFRITCQSEDECRQLAHTMARHPDRFSNQLTIHFLQQRRQQQRRMKTINATVASESRGQSTLADIKRRFSDAPFALVTPQDRDNILTETLNDALQQSSIDDAFDDALIDHDDEMRWRRHLANLIFEPYYYSTTIASADRGDGEGDDALPWQSLYWRGRQEYQGDDDNQHPRPDIFAKKLNRIYSAATEKERQWIARHLAAIGDVQQQQQQQQLEKMLISADTLQSLANALQTAPHHQLVSERLYEIVNSRNRSSSPLVQWNGNRFLPIAPSGLTKINLQKLRQISVGGGALHDSSSPWPLLRHFVPDLSLNVNVRPEMTSPMNFERNPIAIPESIDGSSSSPSTADRRTDKSPGGGLLQSIGTAITGRGLEIAPYTVIRTEEDYEERLYPAQKWVKTRLQHTSRDAASSVMFWKLFNYISGENDRKVKIAMTAPVSVLIEPGSGPNCESTFTMAFYVPDAFQGDDSPPPPIPTNPDVSIEERPEFKVFARTYGGFTNDRITEQERDLLWSSLTDQDKEETVAAVDDANADTNESASAAAPYYFAGYDPPFKLFFRRNEIWMIIRRRDDTSISQQQQQKQQQ